MEQTCQECDKPIFGRRDKKFCSDSCRNTFNNKQNSDSVNLVRNINNALRKNRRILESTCPEDKAKTNRKSLLAKGFDFNFITSITKKMY